MWDAYRRVFFRYETSLYLSDAHGEGGGVFAQHRYRLAARLNPEFVILFITDLERFPMLP